MTTRPSGKTVTFRHPFRLSAVDDVQPAGRYLVEADEEQLQSLSFPAYRRRATLIHLAGMPGSNELARVVDIDPAELASALARDGPALPTASIPPYRIATTVREGKRSTRKFLADGCKRWVALNVTELTWTALVAGGVALAGLATWGGRAAS
jgi:hypothetical protein